MNKIHIEIPHWNEQLIKFAHDYRKHLINLIQLTNSEKEFEFMSGKGKFKMGMVFKLDNHNQFTVRFTVHTDKTTIITACYEPEGNNRVKAQYILQTLYFIFSKPNQY